MNTADSAFTKSKKIYLNDADFAALNNQYAEFIDFFSADKIIDKISASDKIIDKISESDKSADEEVQNHGGHIIIKIFTDSNYMLWINGVPVSFSQHPCYPDTPCYDEIDITDKVHGGENKLAVLTYHQGLSTSTYLKGTPGLIFEIKYYADGENTGILLLSSSKETLSRIAPEYSSGEIPAVSPQLGYTFEYDSITYDGWEQCGYEIARGGRSRICWLYSAELDESKEYVRRPVKRLLLEEPAAGNILAQGIFDYGSEFRRSRAQSPAFYMQNAALKSKRFKELCTDESSRVLSHCTHPLLPSYTLNTSTESPKAEFSYLFSDEQPGIALAGKGIYAIIDLKHEECGYLNFDIDAPKGTVITIGYGDHLDDLRVRSYIGGRNYSCSYICRGKRSSFTHFIHRIAGRYLQIFAECNKLTVYSLGLIPVRYPVSESRSGRFSYSDSLHEKIYETALHTLKLCMHEHYEDCPHREQALYAMDSRNQMLCGYYAFGEYKFAKESLRLLAQGIRTDGLLELCAPASVPVTIPSFSLYWIQALTEYALYSGDLDFTIKQLPVAEKIMKHFSLHSMPGKALMTWRGEPYWNFHEWSPGLSGDFSEKIEASSGGNCYDANLTALFIVALERMAQTYAFIALSHDFKEELGTEYMKKANSYLDLCETMRGQFNNFFFDSSLGLYASYSCNCKLHDYSGFTNSLAIYCGACTGSLLSVVAEALKNGGSAKARLNDVTLSHAIYKYEALMLAESQNIDYVMKDIERKWGNMLFSGATSFWETLGGASDFDDAGSLCHGWSAIPIIIYFKYILGLRPIRPGFEEYTCNPRQYKSHEASGSVAAPFCRFDIAVTPEHYNCRKKEIFDKTR